jgi:hypothetical protein
MVELAINIVSFLICAWAVLALGAVVLGVLASPFIAIGALANAIDRSADEGTRQRDLMWQRQRAWERAEDARKSAARFTRYGVAWRKFSAPLHKFTP